MRFSTSAIVACAFAFVAAQDLSSIPSCALPCFATAIQQSGCSLSDTKCQCTTGSAKITESLTSCAPARCQGDDLNKIAPAAAALCSAAGYPLSSAAAAASGTSMMASMASSMPASAMMSSAMMSGSKTASMAAASSMTKAASSALPQQTTGAGAANFVNGALVVAMGVLAL